MSDISAKKPPKRPGTQFVVRVELDFAAKIKKRAKSLGYKTEPYIRLALECEQEHGIVEPNRDSVEHQIASARALGYVQGLLSGVEIPEPDRNDPKNACRVL